MTRPHWDDALVQADTFAGVALSVYQRAADKHQSLAVLFKSGWLIGACVTAFGVVAFRELQGRSTSPEAHRAGKRKNLVWRVIFAVAVGYGLPGMSGQSE